MAGSIRRAGGETRPSAASDNVMLCPMVNAVTTMSGLPAAAEQQQADEKQDVVRSDQDVLNP